MERRHASSLFVLALAAFLGAATNVAAQGDNDKDRAGTDQKSSSANCETIRGLIAGVTAEGEVYYNHQTNSAVKTEGAFLTVVATPTPTSMEKGKESARESRRAAEKAAANTQAGARTNESETRHHHGDHRRHNVYIVWLTPKTKVCAAPVAGAAKSTDGSAKSEAEKKEMAFDQLEVGDQVEIEFTAFEDSDAHKHVHQSQHMQSKHGRHRTHVGYASAITILSTPDHGQNASDHVQKSPENPK